MSHKNLLITFDYELFLGRRSGRPMDCMLRPTDRLLEILNRYHAKAIFFVDTTYLCRLLEQIKTHPECKEDFDAISKQLLKIIDQGHYIQPHIHPHWLDAKYNAETREFDLTNINRYRFHQLSTEERKTVFNSSIEVLKKIIQHQFPNYYLNAFRAGGWSIQPFSDFKEYFIENNIQYDLTVVNKLYQFSNAQIFDYSDVPDKNVYRFEDRVEEEKTMGKFIQIKSSVIPITKKMDFSDRLYKKILNLFKLDKNYGLGAGHPPLPIQGKPKSQNGINIFSGTHEVASFENLSLIKLHIYKKHLIDNNYLHLVSHPKMLGRHNFYVIEKFLKAVNKNYKIETDFIKIAESYLNETTNT